MYDYNVKLCKSDKKQLITIIVPRGSTHYIYPLIIIYCLVMRDNPYCS